MARAVAAAAGSSSGGGAAYFVLLFFFFLRALLESKPVTDALTPIESSSSAGTADTVKLDPLCGWRSPNRVGPDRTGVVCGWNFGGMAAPESSKGWKSLAIWA